jgi:signal transduction histidine kinase
VGAVIKQMELNDRITTAAFQTRARTIDHLGREQIADCPTAIAELWKNSYDAYAPSVALHLFDGDILTAALVDNGHGMSRQEFVDKWLVVGTESKVPGEEGSKSDEKASKDDRLGLPFREPQGQKGIGRLSAAALGPLLLLVSKRQSEPFVAALTDWRLFENPFLYLQDIEIPIVAFDVKAELLDLLPSMFERLMGNVWGNGASHERDERISSAWRRFDSLNEEMSQPSVRARIESTLVDAAFGPRQLDQWPVWSGDSAHGTALIVADISFDLEAQLPGRVSDADESLVEQAKERLFQTLSNFTDPFAGPNKSSSGGAAPEFRYSVTAWEGMLTRPVVSDERSFRYEDLEDLEHVVDGEVDKAGIFLGRVKAFGQWLPSEMTVNPISPVPNRADSVVGPFHVRLGTFEQVQLASSHSAAVHANLVEQAGKYAGFMVYRDGLRVMPYGREDNDFFEIEKRRTLSAGREFWSNRRLFGRVALTRELNPNLKDKAGREGIIDNKAAKAFRDIVENILMVTARKFFGSASPVRKEFLPDVKAARKREQAKLAEKQVRSRKRREFRGNLENALGPIKAMVNDLEVLAEQARSNSLPADESSLITLGERVNALKQIRAELSLGPPPATLGSLEDDYRQYREYYLRSGDLIANLNSSLSSAIERFKPQTKRDIAYSALSRNAVFLQDRIRKWSAEAKQLLSSEIARVASVVDDRNRRYHTATLSLLEGLDNFTCSISEVLERLDAEKERQDRENSEFFDPYISTLRDLRESVDLEALVTVTMDDADQVRSEINRLNALAQLGITVEIVGHEIEGLDMTISNGLRELADRNQGNAVFDSIKTAHEELTDRLRFLSPLKLSGERRPTTISGADIYNYVSNFLSKILDSRSIEFYASPAFRRFSVFDEPSRIFPVFINLVNNAAYWVGQSRYLEKNILLDAENDLVFIADDGPGIDPDDIKSLFSLFFTRKVRGGRGVGLYLCRANLAAGGHSIFYVTDPSMKKLSGANFAIEFRGGRYE